jgi:hypothetical protein
MIHLDKRSLTFVGKRDSKKVEQVDIGEKAELGG